VLNISHNVQEGLVPYNVDLTVKGDVSIAIWFGMYNMGQRLNTKPDLAYCFHTAFAESGVERVKARDLDVSDPTLFPDNPVPEFFMDIKLEDAADAVVVEDDSEEVDYSSDVQHWRSKWEETKIKVFGVNAYPQVILPADCKNQDAVCARAAVVKQADIESVVGLPPEGMHIVGAPLISPISLFLKAQWLGQAFPIIL
jgi:hypothetical protein